MRWTNPLALQTRLGRIAYFGGSVTAQKQGYRPALHLKLVQHLERPHLPINAGVGGIGMAGGVFLMDDLVIARRPDFCFIEFSTADYSGGLPLDEGAAALEGALRKLAAIGCPACLLHLYRDDTDYSQIPPVVAAFDEVAAYYGVPSLHIGAHMAAEFSAGRIQKSAMLKDIVHLTTQGAKWVAEAIFGAALGMWKLAPEPESPVGASFHPNPYQVTHIIPAPVVLLLADGWSAPGRFGGQYDFVQVGEGQGFTVTCDGTLAGMLVVVGPDSGVIDADGQRIQLWDRWCTYERLQTVLFWPQFPQATPVRINLTDEQVDYSSSRDYAFSVFDGKKTLKVIGFLVKK